MMNHAGMARPTPWVWMLLATCAVTAVTAVIGPPVSIALVKVIF